MGGGALNSGSTVEGDPLRSRWLGLVPYDEAYELQRAMFRRGRGQHLLLLEHGDVYTIGRSGDRSHLLVDPDSVGASFREVDRGGDITYHGPGQLVGYPIVTPPSRRGGGMADTVAYVTSVEQLLIDMLIEFGLEDVGRLSGYPGVWVSPESAPRKIAAIGVKLSRGRSMHGFALNVDPDLAMFDHIVPCGIADKAVTSLAAEGVDVTMNDVVEAVSLNAASLWGDGRLERQDVLWKEMASDLAPFSRGAGAGDVVRPYDHMKSTSVAASSGASSVASGLQIGRHRGPGARLAARLDQVGVGEGLSIGARKPEWLRARVNMGASYRELKRTMRSNDLVTVCEEAGCPNIYECWSEGTATFMINGERCTRACGFCLVDTRKPDPIDPEEAVRVANATAAMGLRHVVVTAVARDDLADGGASGFVDTISAMRETLADVAIEVLIPDCKGVYESLDAIFDARPDVMNHNLETVARLQRAVRPSAGYARSLAVLARSKAAGLVTKSGLIVGMGETDDEVFGALADLGAIGCDIVTVGQYLRPTSNHLPVNRWVEPEMFETYAMVGLAEGIGHVESSPLTRSSYHAGSAAALL